MALLWIYKSQSHELRIIGLCASDKPVTNLASRSSNLAWTNYIHDIKFIWSKVRFRLFPWQRRWLKTSQRFWIYYRFTKIQSLDLPDSLQLVTLIFVKKNNLTKLWQTVFESFKKIALIKNLIVSQNRLRVVPHFPSGIVGRANGGLLVV